MSEPFDSENLPVTLASDIQRFLRVANQIQVDEPRVAYLCRFHAFEVAHKLDRTSIVRGVRQFKTALIQRLGQAKLQGIQEEVLVISQNLGEVRDDDVTIRKRKEKNDLRELQRVYQEFKDYIIKHGGEYTLETREMMIKAYAVASVLYEILSTITSAAGSQGTHIAS